MKIILLPIIFGVLLLLTSTYFLISNKMNESTSYFWIIVSLTSILIGVIAPTKIFSEFSKRLGVDYPPSLFFFAALLFVFFVLIKISILQSKQENLLKSLIQDMALQQNLIDCINNEK